MSGVRQEVGGGPRSLSLDPEMFGWALLLAVTAGLLAAGTVEAWTHHLPIWAGFMAGMCGLCVGVYYHVIWWLLVDL